MGKARRALDGNRSRNRQRRYVCRWYYRSMSGEVVANDSVPMPHATAHSRSARLALEHIGVEVLNAKTAHETPLQYGATRLVVVPVGMNDGAQNENLACRAALSGLSAEERQVLAMLVGAPGYRLRATAFRSLYAHRTGLYRAIEHLVARELVEKTTHGPLFVSLRADNVSSVAVHVRAPKT